uniref:Uncharacterized protein n=1 Tax=Solanum lycopersicum TaxID=4081 RepID=A0A3Q7FV37_SOLLC
MSKTETLPELQRDNEWKDHAMKSGMNIVVSIPACHAGDPGSIPGNGVRFCPAGDSGFPDSSSRNGN